MPSLGKFIKHASQYNDKFQVHLQIHTAFGVKVSSNSAHYFVQFKRGDHKGSTMKLNSADPSSIVFDSSCSFTFPCTLYYYDVAKKDYEEKLVTVYFNEENLADPTGFITHGKTNIDLAKYAKEVPLNSSKAFPLTEVLSKPKKGDALRLQVTLTITCVCVNDPTKSEECAAEPLPTPSPSPSPAPPPPSSTPSHPPSSLPTRSPSAPIHIPASPAVGRGERSERGGEREGSKGKLVHETSASSTSGLESLRGRSDDGESISSLSSRNSPRNSLENSPPSSPSSSPSSSPPRFSGSFEAGSNGSVGSGNPLSSFSSPLHSLSSSSSTSHVKSYLQTPPIKMHLLDRQGSDSLLNTSDIGARLANKRPELCNGTPAPGTPIPGTPTQGTPRMDPLRMSSDHVRVDSLRVSSDHLRMDTPLRTSTDNMPLRASASVEHISLRVSTDQFSSSPRSLPRRLDFKNEGRIKSSNDLKSPMLQKALLQKQKDDERYLVDEIIPQSPYYSNGVPILAYVVFRALLRWRAFHPNNQFIDSFFTAFNNLITILPKIDFMEALLYRLSTAATLRHILHTELQVLSSDNVSTVLKDFSRRLKKSMLSFYELYYSKVKEELDEAIRIILADVKQGKAEDVTPVFEKHLKLVSESCPFEALQHQIIYQIFYYFNAKMLNSLLQHNTPSQCAVGLGLKMLVLHIENWAAAQNVRPAPQPQSEGVVQLQCDSMLGWVYNQCRKALSGVRQAADVLVVKKSTLIDPKIRAEVCPSLTPQQLFILLERYVPDEFDPEPMHPGVLKSISDELPPENAISPTTPLLDASQPSPLSTSFSLLSPLPLHSLSIPPVILNHPSFSFLRDACTDSNTQW